MKKVTTRKGYILLLTILVIGVVATAIVSSLLLLGTSSNRGSYSVQQSAQSLAFSYGCAEYALLKLYGSANYNGDEQIQFPEGTCDILPIGGVAGSNTNRFICTEALSGDAVRRMEVIVSSLLPKIDIYSWQEVLAFSICS